MGDTPFYTRPRSGGCFSGILEIAVQGVPEFIFQWMGEAGNHPRLMNVGDTGSRLLAVLGVMS